jgi:hypothetical protein
LHPLIQCGSLRAQGFELGFDLFQIAFEALCLTTQGWHREAFGLLPLGH